MNEINIICKGDSMIFKSFFKLNIIIQLVFFSFSFADIAISARSSSQFEECLHLEINSSNISGDIDCHKTSGSNSSQHLNMNFVSGLAKETQIQKKSIATFPYISDGITIGGITDISTDQTIYVASLHMFLKPWDNKNEVLNSYLRDKLPLLVHAHSNTNTLKYFDLVLFIDNKILDSIDFNQNLESRVTELRRILIHKIKYKSLESTDTDLEWISPDQFSKVDNDAAKANSNGRVALLVKRSLTNENKSYTEFYLNDSSNNFSTAGSSGSVIFDSRSELPLGLLQCQMTEDLFVKGVLQKTKNLYKTLSFDILNNFDLHLLKMNQFIQLKDNITIEKIELHPSCSPRDGKGGG